LFRYSLYAYGNERKSMPLRICRLIDFFKVSTQDAYILIETERNTAESNGISIPFVTVSVPHLVDTGPPN
jgi:hypothetical protein